MTVLAGKRAKIVYGEAAEKLRKEPVIQYLRTLPGHEKFAEVLKKRAQRKISNKPKATEGE